MNSNGRKQYTVMDVLQQAQGLPTDGWGVLTKGFIDDLRQELVRLYQIEDELPQAIEQLKTAVAELEKPVIAPEPGALSPQIVQDGSPRATALAQAARTLRNLSDLCGIGISAPV